MRKKHQRLIGETLRRRQMGPACDPTVKRVRGEGCLRTDFNDEMPNPEEDEP